jgi:hypothetical protein
MIVPEDYFMESNSSNNVYRVEDDKVRCLNCTADENGIMMMKITRIPIKITKDGVY